MYAPGKTKPMNTFKRDLAGPASLAMDSANNLYVANQRNRSITIFPFLKPNHPRQITKGVAKPIAIISSSGELYVLDYSKSSLSAYDETTLKRVAVRSDGIQCPSGMTLSTTGDLFVTNSCPSGVSIYSASDLTLEGSISHGISYPVAVSVSQ
jgi:DNA-binding beta-propeller fold protein YncE